MLEQVASALYVSRQNESKLPVPNNEVEMVPKLNINFL